MELTEQGSLELASQLAVAYATDTATAELSAKLTKTLAEAGYVTYVR